MMKHLILPGSNSELEDPERTPHAVRGSHLYSDHCTHLIEGVRKYQKDLDAHERTPLELMEYGTYPTQHDKLGIAVRIVKKEASEKLGPAPDFDSCRLWATVLHAVGNGLWNGPSTHYKPLLLTVDPLDDAIVDEAEFMKMPLYATAKQKNINSRAICSQLQRVRLTVGDNFPEGIETLHLQIKENTTDNKILAEHLKLYAWPFFKVVQIDKTNPDWVFVPFAPSDAVGRAAAMGSHCKECAATRASNHIYYCIGRDPDKNWEHKPKFTLELPNERLAYFWVHAVPTTSMYERVRKFMRQARATALYIPQMPGPMRMEVLDDEG